MESSNQVPFEIENSQKEQRSNMESCNQAPIDEENPNTLLATSMKREYDALSPLSSECCIYRVPERLRSVKENAYTPQVVSIGPLHHGKDGLKAMEEHKTRYLWDYIQRTGVRLKHYIDIVRDKEKRLRSCYEETIGFNSDEFVKIILVDSVFIIELLLRRYIKEFRNEKHDRIFHKPWMLYDIWPDLQLLENQLPFFILEDLFDPEKITIPSKHTENLSKTLSIVKLSYEFFTSCMDLKGTEENLENMSSTTIQHFVDFLRNLFVPVSPSKGRKCERLIIPSTTELDQAGVKFKVSPCKNLLDIRFENGILEIPKLILSGGFVLMIRNVIAFEQCHYKDNYMSDYVWIMDKLINTPKDVELLVKYGIVDNLGENSKASTMINELGVGVLTTSENFYFADIFENLNDYCKKSRHKWKANLKQNYFNTPWAALSVIAAVLIIILTVIQAICSIISVT